MDFRNTVIIMTSNLGSQAIAELAGADRESEMEAAVREVLRREFLPEFLNRIDETVIFHPLGMAELTKIVDLQLNRLEAMLVEAGLALSVTPKAKWQLAEEGFDPTYGARPLKRVIQKRLANPIATAVLDGSIPRGTVVQIDWDESGERFTFTPVESATASAGA